MLKSKTQLETNKYELLVTVDKETFLQALSKVAKEKSKNITIPGFRKGKAPRNLIERYYGEDVFYGDAIDECYPKAYDDAIAEFGMTIVSKPELSVEKVDRDGAEFKAVVWTKPDIGISNYKGIAVERAFVEVTDAEVDSDISQTRERNSRMISLDGKAENGNISVIDFEGFVDGVAFEGGKAEKYELTLGSGSFIPGFEDQIIGHLPGEEFDVNVRFPDEYGAEHLAGKDCVFKVRLHELKKKELPELDDEFVKDVSEFDTVEEYKKSIREKILATKDARADDETDIAIAEKLCALIEGEIPEVMFESAVDDAVREFDYRIRMQGADIDKYLQYTGMAYEDFRKNFRAQAESRVKNRLAFEKIAELEGITVSEEDIAEEYKKLAERYGDSEENLKKYITEAELIEDIKVSKSVALVKENAKITQLTAKKEKPADKPKKAPAKAAAKDSETKAEEKPAAKKAAPKTTAAKPAAAKPAAKAAGLAEGESKPKTAAKPAAKKADEPKSDKSDK